MRILIVGCGYVGTALGAELAGRGHLVSGLRRSHQHAAGLNAVGVLPLTADITQPESLPSTLPVYDWVVLCASASPGGGAQYRRVYIEGTRNLLAWLRAAPPCKLVYTSSTSVYGQTQGEVVDETSPTEPNVPTARILVEAEALLMTAARQMGLESVVLRVAGIYGPGRSYWLDQVRSGNAPFEGRGERVVNMIHRDDVVGAVISALNQGKPGRVYNVVDDEPVAESRLFEWLSQRLGRPPPRTGAARPMGSGTRAVTNKRVSNLRLKSELGYRFKCPTFREGYNAILR